MSDSGTSSSDGSTPGGAAGDGSGSEPTISFEKNAAPGPVYGAPDPSYGPPNWGSDPYGASGGDDRGSGAPDGPPPGAGYPPPPFPGGGPQYGGPQYGGPQYGGPQYGGPHYPGPQYAGAPGWVDPSAPYGRHPVTGEPFSDKQKLTAGLLNILLGVFGAGRFYLNQPGIAVAQIAVTWLTCGIGGIWPLIDGIMMLTGSVRDEHGRPLRD
ncbi:TM2 domain-containing protein [Rhodococcoides fascians]|uniref:TM2 domain-containing protein n=1 Tax=Rhodococcoides fascians TaxID=1828 RepID=UPI0024BAE57F|nr:TM2 domain-containing protein [Rhodococcus fascians]MDJ0411621.1 TM2 domain-containing protein [Rhodococcus fascians]